MKKTTTRKRPNNWVLRRTAAQLLFPDSPPAAQVDRLYRWIQGDPQLLQKLQKVGYRNGTHYLSPSMMKLLYRYLG